MENKNRRKQMIRWLQEIAGSLCAGTIFGLVIGKEIPLYNVFFPAFFLIVLGVRGFFSIRGLLKE